MTIYLAPEIRSGLGERTFWDWAADEFPGATFNRPQPFQYNSDCLLQYSTLGPPDCVETTPPRLALPGHRGKIALCWELYFEMREQLRSAEWDSAIARTEACAAACDHRVVSTHFAVPFYSRFGHVDLLPIGVDCELFKPVDPSRKPELRAKLCIPENRRIGFWMGTNHAMKGFDRLEHYAAENPDIWWVIVWKTKREQIKGKILRNAVEFTHVPQAQLAELMNTADFFLACGRLRPFFMVEWECMACDLPCVNASGLEKDFEPSFHPREDVLRLGWDRVSAKKKWLDYLGV